MYKVVERFNDKTDGHFYEVGDTFPYNDRNVAKARIEALAKGKNDFHCVFIKEEK